MSQHHFRLRPPSTHITYHHRHHPNSSHKRDRLTTFGDCHAAPNDFTGRVTVEAGDLQQLPVQHAVLCITPQMELFAVPQIGFTNSANKSMHFGTLDGCC